MSVLSRHCRVKILATLGPSCDSPDILDRMVEAGVDAVRLNCSHAGPDDLSAYVSLVRGVSERLDYPVGILLDLSGPKLRTTRLEDGRSVRLEEDGELRIVPGLEVGTRDRIGCTHSGLAEDVAPGERILLDDGRIEVRVERVEEGEVLCRVVRGGLLKEHKGLNLPGTRLSLPALTEKDRADLAVGLELGVDFVALSFVQTAEDVRELRREIAKAGEDTPVIAKIERPLAVENLDEILDVAEGVMVARGDLGVEAGAHRVPMIQKRILHESSSRAVIDITATQMLESMVENPQPTRAEASDVANAILDGTDAVMLSEETAAGKHPLEAVAIMNKIALEVESEIGFLPSFGARERGPRDQVGLEMAQAACLIARHERFKVIIVLTESGLTARAVSTFGPRVPILALTPNRKTWLRLTLVRGVRPLLLSDCATADELFAAGEAEAKRRGLVRKGEQGVLVTGAMMTRGQSNILKILRIR